MDWLQTFSDYLSALVDNPVVAELVFGAVEGVLIGLLAGSIIYAIMQAPDALGRAIFLGIMFGIVAIVYETFRIGNELGIGMASMIRNMNINPNIGPMFWKAGLNTMTAMFIGGAIGVGSLVPNHMMRGGFLGAILGAIVGGGISVGLYYGGVSVNLWLFRGAVVLGIWAVLATFGGK